MVRIHAGEPYNVESITCKLDFDAVYEYSYTEGVSQAIKSLVFYEAFYYED